MSSWPYYLPSGNQKRFWRITLAAEHRLSLRPKIWALCQVAGFRNAGRNDAATFTIAVAFRGSKAVGEHSTVIFLSPRECQGFHGKSLDRYQPIRFGSLLDRLLKVS